MILSRALAEAPPHFDLSGNAGTAILCLLISAWLHLVFFTVWQYVDAPAADRFYFNLESESPAIELTLSLSEPPAELTAEEEAALAALERYIESAQAQAPEESLEEAAAPEPTAPEPEEPAAELPPPEISPQTILNPETEETTEGAEAPTNPDPPLAVEAEAPAFKSYYTAIRRAINQRWVLPPEATTQFRPSRLTCDFTIARDGTLLRIVVIESSGSATLDHAGLEALRAAAPFPPFTPDLAAFSQLDIRMQFDYQAKYISK